MRDYMVRRVISATWGPPNPCKQALSKWSGTLGPQETEHYKNDGEMGNLCLSSISFFRMQPCVVIFCAIPF